MEILGMQIDPVYLLVGGLIVAMIFLNGSDDDDV